MITGSEQKCRSRVSACALVRIILYFRLSVITIPLTHMHTQFYSISKPSKGQKQLKLEQGENISTPGKKTVILPKKKWKVQVLR